MKSENNGTPALPEAFLGRMKGMLGEEYEAFVQSYGEKRVQGLRFNPLKGSPDGMAEQYKDKFGLRRIPWCPEGYYYQEETRPGRHPLHEAGVYYIQEPSAMAAAELLEPQPGECVLDLCAAPGGKTTQIAAKMQGKGLLVSNEIHPARAKILSQNVERMGIVNAVVTNETPKKLAGYFLEFFDRIVVDAPCSGEGMFRKDEQVRQEWSEEHVTLCAARQREILGYAAGMLKPGGRMVYSTCTFAPEENEAQVAHFLEQHPEFSVVETAGCEGLSPGEPSFCPVPCETVKKTFRIWPHKAQGEGHYIAVLKKEKGAGSPKRKYPRYWKEKAGICTFREFVDSVWKGESCDLEKNLVLFGDNLYRIPDQMVAFDGLKILRPGLHLGAFRKNRFEPSHAWAKALNAWEVKQACHLPGEGTALREYLAGNTLEDREGRKGWILVCAGDYAMGWAKAANKILKNHYPKGLRIPV